MPLSRRCWSWAALIAAFAFLAVRQLVFVNRHAVNMMFWDQWDLYYPFFHHKGPWAIFDFQFGPHRQGVGFLLTRVIAGATGWNSRGDAFGISGLLIAAALAGLGLAWRCGVRSPLLLIAVPLLFFSVHQYEHFVGPSNLSHAAMPVLLLMLYGLSWFIRNPSARCAALSVLAFFMFFTGFAQMGGFVSLVSAAAEVAARWRTSEANQRSELRWSIATLIFSLLALALFLNGFQFDRMDPLPRSAFYVKPSDYLVFVALMLANFCGLPANAAPISIVIGSLIAVLLIVIAISHVRPVWREGPAARPVDTIILFFCVFTFLYTAETAAGRAHLGLTDAPAASRYVTLLIPAALAIFLHLATAAAGWNRMTVVVYVLCLIPATMRLTNREKVQVDWYVNGRRNWKAAYLATHDEEKANQIAQFKVFPYGVGDRLSFLERNRLNLFLPENKPSR